MRKILLYPLAFAAACLLACELACLTLINVPALLARLPESAAGTVERLYNENIRNIVQFMPECARYDGGLAYTLKPGKFVFSNPEFASEFFVNSRGVRDDEKSLKGPEVIVLGDSHAMGWGVGQEETFAQVLERETGARVLNAGVSSYGTAREMLMLRGLDRGRLKFLIVQYHRNDRRENESFYLGGNKLPIMSRDEYARLSAEHARLKKYFFGKYSIKALSWRGETLELSERKNNAKTDTDKDDTELFLNALLHSQVDLRGVRIIVFRGLNRWDARGGEDLFSLAVKKKIAAGNYPGFIRDMAVLDLSRILLREDFYALDEHPNASGHRKIARVLLEAMAPRRGAVGRR